MRLETLQIGADLQEGGEAVVLEQRLEGTAAVAPPAAPLAVACGAVEPRDWQRMQPDACYELTIINSAQADARLHYSESTS